MNRGTNSPIKGFSANRITLFAAAMGGGAGTNGTIPGNGQLDDANGKYPKAENFASALTYNASTGLYIMTLTESVKHILFATGIVVDSGSAPTSVLECAVTAIVPSTKSIYVKIFAPNGTLTDLGTSDMLILKVDAADTSSIG